MKTRSIPKLAEELVVQDADTGDEKASDEKVSKKKTALTPNYQTEHDAIIENKKAITSWKLITIGMVGTNVLLGIITIGMLSTAISRSMPTLITRGNGETENLEFFVGNNRSPTLIKFFAEKVVTNLYTWRATLPEPGNPIDPGITVDGGKTIPTTAYRGSLALEPSFAASFREQLSKLESIVQGNNNKQTQTVYLPQQVGEPESIGAGKWKIKVVGTQLIVASSSEAPKKFPINLELSVRAVAPPLLSEVTRKYHDIGIAKAAQMARAEGLEVISISNLK